MWKNQVIMRRHPCSLCCELLFATCATSILVVIRALSGVSSDLDVLAETHVKDTIPVQLPECTEYVDECAVKLISTDEGALCLQGINFGCLASANRAELGVWVNKACNGTFEVGDVQIHCNNHNPMRTDKCFPSDQKDHAEDSHKSDRRLQMKRTFHVGPPGRRHRDADEDEEDDEEYGRGHRGSGGSYLQSVAMAYAMGQDGMPGKRRYEAKFAVAPAKWAAPFKAWLEENQHPWASNVELFDDAESVQKHVESSDYPIRDPTTNISHLLCGGLIFDTDPASQKVQYTLRFNLTSGSQAPLGSLRHLKPRVQTQSLYDQASGGFFSGMNSFDADGLQWYSESGFLAMQRTVDTFIAGTEESLAPPIARSILGDDGRLHFVVPFPTPSRRNDSLFSIPHLLDEFLLLSLTITMWSLITSVVKEREARLREGMRMMGLHPTAFILSWVLTYVIIVAIVSCGVVFCLSGGGVLLHTSASLLWCWIFLYSLACISYGLLLSTFFQKAKQAAVLGSLIFYFSSMLHQYVSQSPSTFSMSIPSVLASMACLFPPVPFVLGAKIFQLAEMQDSGIGWSNIDYSFQIGVRAFSVGESCRYLAFDAVFLMLIFLYADQVVPRDIGVQRPWYFIFSWNFWKEVFGCDAGENPAMAKQMSRQTSQRTQSGADIDSASALIERDIGEAAAMMARTGQVVELRHLSKTYGEVQAVQDLDLMMYGGEIFALLGHNGAGKTTTLAMLCGLVKPTSGSCNIFGYDLVQDRDQAQRLLGVCPQHDVLWESLTAEEHLLLFGGFKGMTDTELAAEVPAMLNRVRLFGLDAKRHAGKLSGGMKRKLSIGIAFIGGSKLVLLDEPTSGLDPFSRRMVWELLRSMKPGRATVLSTHYMDEADILGDRIAILHEGCLRCCGSSNFLKRAYGCGYNITLVLKDGAESTSVHDAVMGLLPETINKSEVRTLSHSGKELIIQLPFTVAKFFPEVLGGLETKMEELKLESYGISVTTLEEVFLKVASGEAMEVKTGNGKITGSTENYVAFDSPRGATQGTGGSHNIIPTEEALPQRLVHADQASPAKRFCTHVYALLRKRVRYGMRDWKGFMCQLAVPLLLLTFLLALFSYRFFHPAAPLKLEAARYNEQCGSNTVPFSYVPNAVPAAEARSLLEHGRSEYRGSLQQHDPDPELHLSTFEERILTMSTRSLYEELKAASTNPKDANLPWQDEIELQKGIARALVTLNQRVVELTFKHGTDIFKSAAGSANELSSPKQPTVEQKRRLEASQTDKMEMVLVDEFVKMFLRSWSQVQSLSQAWRELWSVPAVVVPVLKSAMQSLFPTLKLPGWIEAFQDNHRRLQADSQPEGEGGSNGNGDSDGESESQPRAHKPMEWFMHPFNQSSERDPAFVAKACLQGPERMMYEAIDTDRDGNLSKQELIHAFAAPAANIRQASAKAQSGFTSTITESEAADVLADVLISAFDENHDHISPQAICAFSERARGLLEHVYTLGEHFSEQLLNTSTSNGCFRYGGYFVVTGARHADDPPKAPGSHALVFANSTSSHSAASFQAAYTNARLHRLNPGKRVEVTTHPFPHTFQETKELEKDGILRLAGCVCFSLAFIPASIIQYVVKERAVGARQLQVLSGASPVSYWLATFLYDMALYSVQAVLMPFLLHGFGFSMLLHGDGGRAFTVVLITFGPAIAGFTYTVSFLFKDHSKASYYILAFCLIGATIFSMILSLLWLWNFDPTNEYPMACERSTETHPNGNCRNYGVRYMEMFVSPLFRLVPTVSAYQAIIAIAVLAKLREAFSKEAYESFKSFVGEQMGPKLSFSVFSDDWAGLAIKYLIGEACTFLFVAIVADWWMHNPGVAKRTDPAYLRQAVAKSSTEARSRPLMSRSGEEGDESVQQERDYVAQLAPSDAALRVDNLEKAYHSWLNFGSPKVAVKGISFSVRNKEVFGLLGHNGAGKTSALKCIVGEQCSTAGALQVGGFDMERDTAKARRRIGYCPQFDALLELLTVHDHLELFAALRNLPHEALQQAQVDFKLSKMMHRRAENLSGGNKRKLSAAIALLGGPSLAVLDEPSCGLDPHARRMLWDTVQSAVRGSQGATMRASSVLLTTHSMEEAEALSTRLGIMATGEMLAIGTVQQIKQRHGGSHELCLSLRPIPPEEIRSFLERLQVAAPHVKLNFNSIQPLLTAFPLKWAAYQRPRCVVRTQIESFEFVEASVFAEWWCQQDRGDAIHAVLQQLHQECGSDHASVELVENIGAMSRFRMPSSSCRLPDLFKRIEQESDRLSIQEYTITQASLEQIFNSIAQEAHQ